MWFKNGLHHKDHLKHLKECVDKNAEIRGLNMEELYKRGREKICPGDGITNAKPPVKATMEGWLELLQ